MGIIKIKKQMNRTVFAATLAVAIQATQLTNQVEDLMMDQLNFAQDSFEGQLNDERHETCEDCEGDFVQPEEVAEEDVSEEDELEQYIAMGPDSKYVKRFCRSIKDEITCEKTHPVCKWRYNSRKGQYNCKARRQF